VIGLAGRLRRLAAAHRRHILANIAATAIAIDSRNLLHFNINYLARR